MKAICKSASFEIPASVVTRALDVKTYRYNVVPGKIYVALGVSFVRDSSAFGTTVLLEIFDETEYLMSIPSELFEIIDARVSRFWHARDYGLGVFAVWPPLFFEESFHEKLADRDPGAMTLITLLLRKLSEEFQETDHG